MFLLLAPSLLTGKRPGLYCPRGWGSQDAPKGPKEEQRGCIVRHDKELHSSPHTHTLFRKQNFEISSFTQLLSHSRSFKIQVIIKTSRK